MIRKSIKLITVLLKINLTRLRFIQWWGRRFHLLHIIQRCLSKVLEGFRMFWKKLVYIIRYSRLKNVISALCKLKSRAILYYKPGLGQRRRYRTLLTSLQAAVSQQSADAGRKRQSGSLIRERFIVLYRDGAVDRPPTADWWERSNVWRDTNPELLSATHCPLVHCTDTVQLR